jgi:holin-like protein
MIAGLVQLLFFQGAGELISKFLLPTLPGPVVGLVLLLIFLMVRKEVNQSLSLVGDAFLRNLGLLFVPAAVGVALFLPLLRANALAIIAAIVGSVALTIAVSALLLRWTYRGEPHE